MITAHRGARGGKLSDRQLMVKPFPFFEMLPQVIGEMRRWRLSSSVDRGRRDIVVRFQQRVTASLSGDVQLACNRFKIRPGKGDTSAHTLTTASVGITIAVNGDDFEARADRRSVSKSESIPA